MIFTWNVSGICFVSKMYGMWKNTFNNQLDIICSMEHTEHTKCGSSLQHNQIMSFMLESMEGFL